MEITRSALVELYHGGDMTMREVADELDTSPATISRRMKKYGLKTRPTAPNGDYDNGSDGSPSITMNDGYEYFVDNSGDSQKRVGHHRLLALLEHSEDEVGDKIVYHKNEIKWDNRVENLDVLTIGEHNSVHKTT